jgi:ferredoxin
MHITVHPDRCCASGRCVEIAPEVFSFDDDGYVRLLRERADDTEKDILDAAEACPTASIEVSLDAPGSR